MNTNLASVADLSIDSAIENLRAKGAEFARAYQTLMADYDVARTDAALLADWETLKSRADTVRDSIAWINSQVDSAAGWFSSVFGLSGMAAVNAIPLIPVAYVIGATSALVYVIGAIWEFHTRVELVRANQAPGSILAPGQGMIGETSDLLKWVIIGVAGYFLVPEILKKLKG